MERIRKFALNSFGLTLLPAVLLLMLNTCLMEDIKREPGSKRLEFNYMDNPGADSSKGFTLREIDRLKGIFPDAAVSYLVNRQTIASSGPGNFPVKVCLTDHMQVRFHPLRMLRGNYFTRDAGKSGRNVAVISETLAIGLFSSDAVVGKSLTLFNGEPYKIIGVYRPRNTLVPFLASDGVEEVHVPLESLADAGSVRISTVILREEALERDPFRVEKARMLLLNSGVDPALYLINDFYDSHAAMIQWQAIFFLLLGAAAVWFALGLLKARLGKRLAALAERGRQLYPGELLRKEWPAMLAAVLEVLVFCGFMAGVFHAVRFIPHIPSDFIPTDNLFDAGFYFDRLKTLLQEGNRLLLSGYVPSPLELEYGLASKLVFLFSALEIAAFVPVVRSCKVAVLAGNSMRGIIRTVGMAFAASAVLAFLCSFLLGLPWVFPIKEAGVLLAFLYLYGKQKAPEGLPSEAFEHKGSI